MNFLENILQNHRNCSGFPPLEKVEAFIQLVLGTLFPLRTNFVFNDIHDIQIKVDSMRVHLWSLLNDSPLEIYGADEIATSFIDQLEQLYHAIDEDISAMYEGDPAATCREEIIRSYPGFFAISAYRMAHFLHHKNVKILPRSITEIAHQKTGIDIHPGAQIGKAFCIDHGTGVVIGQSSIIGDHVKIYQGVTLGALSVDKADANTKRHPTIEDNVIIYAGATILGGNTVVGKGSIIGGNVWLPRSVPPNSKVYYKALYEDPTEGLMDIITIK